MATLKIIRVFNNNVVLSQDAHQKEIVVMGRGIGFGKKQGDEIALEKIEKTFVLEEPSHQLSDLYQSLPSEEVDMMVEIIDYAEKKLSTVFDANLYLSLADHLHYAIERYHQGIHITNPLAFEVEKYYRQEARLGKEIVALINKRLNIELDGMEATSIALHFINAQQGGNIKKETLEMMRVMEDIMNIVRIDLKVPIDYHRFITHLRYFVIRIFNNEPVGEADSFLFEEVQKNYPEAFSTAQKIKHYIEQTCQYVVGNEELFYLAIHLQRFKR